MSHAIKRIDEMEGLHGGGFKLARAELGASAFGLQVIEMPAGFDRYPDHDHSADGQEEVYVTLSGSGEIEIDGERHPIDPETMVRVGPGVARKVWPGEAGLRLLVVGGVPGKAFEPAAHTELGSADA